MEYFSREVLDSWNGGLGMKQSPLLSRVCHGFQTAGGIVGFLCVFLCYISEFWYCTSAQWEEGKHGTDVIYITFPDFYTKRTLNVGMM